MDKHRHRRTSGGLADFQLPSGVSVSKQALAYGWAYVFRHRTLGELGRIVLQETDDGRTDLSCEVAGDAQDSTTVERMAIFRPLALEISRRMEGSTGRGRPTPDG
jgi:hypothetical protein